MDEIQKFKLPAQARNPRAGEAVLRSHSTQNHFSFFPCAAHKNFGSSIIQKHWSLHISSWGNKQNATNSFAISEWDCYNGG